MYRTTHVRFFRNFGRFLWQHIWMLVFLCLFFIGVGIGCSVYVGLTEEKRSLLTEVLSIRAIVPSFGGFLSAVFSNLLFPTILIGILICAGLSACGAPIVGVVPILYGMGIGMIEAFYCMAENSVWVLIALVIPSTLLGVWTLLMACSEALRMTMRLAGQLLPSSKVSGNLWNELKLYFFRFLIFWVLSIGVALLQVLLRWLYFGT